MQFISRCALVFSVLFLTNPPTFSIYAHAKRTGPTQALFQKPKPRVFANFPQATAGSLMLDQRKATIAARFARQQEFFSCTLSDLEGDGHFPSPFDRSPYAHTREQMCHTLHFGDFQYNNKTN